MGYSGADLFVDTLEQYGVQHVFGNPGTTELPVMKALGDSDLDYVLGLHEDVAVGMAAGYATTRRYHADDDESVLPVGVANLHVAPGLAHGLGNIYGASVAGAPLVVTAGNHSTEFRHEEPILSGDLVEMTQQFTKWSAEVLDVEALPSMLRRAFRVALTPPTGPVFLGLPLDVMMAETDAAPERLGAIPTGGRGDRGQVERAAEAFADAENPVLVVGDGVARAGTDAVDAAVELAEAAGARVHAEILACEVDFPASHDQWVSYIPPDEDTARTLLDTDMVAFVGCSTNTTLTAHSGDLVPDATFVHIGDDAWQLGKNQPADVAALGDPGETMAEIASEVASRVSDDEREGRLERVAAMKQMARAEMESDDETDDPRRSKGELVDALRDAAPDAYIVDEGVTAKYELLTRWPLEPEQAISNKGGGLGYGLPASVGAALAESMRDDPRQVVGHVGDGSYLYYPQSLYSAARYDLDLTVVVPDNRNYRILKNNMQGLFGEGEYEYVGMDFDPPVDIPKNAESHGATGVRVGPDDDLDAALGDALGESGPTVVDVLVHDN
ncbi:thiamine pyrophosphate-binding protein [Salarchaeum japonicum]|uniref:Thiamine pyrophosphate-binding protein n=1 Tax=Salarchaeum japonicum TaxID=555573 RepID=A0AAV3T2N7_9EURY|nr:thiamine pyrophosphate-binding protein [Salarchaeum japonicum]